MNARGVAMPNGTNRILDEFAKLFTDAAGVAQGVRREAETVFKAQAERILNSMDIVQREEFEAVREMAVKAREENRTLQARIAELEARLDKLPGEPADTPASRRPRGGGSKK
jgi:BMFP domain-containing protein YqiC